MAITSLKDSVDSITESFRDAIEFDNKISENKLQYSAWLLAVATAGFAVAVTQADKVMFESVLPPEVGMWLLNLSAVLLGLSAVAGAAVKQQIGKEVESCRQRVTLLLKQRIVLEADTTVVQTPATDDIDELVIAITSVSYLPQRKQQQWKECEEAGDKAGTLYKRLLVAQQSLIGAAYVLIFAASIG